MRSSTGSHHSFIVVVTMLAMLISTFGMVAVASAQTPVASGEAEPVDARPIELGEAPIHTEGPSGVEGEEPGGPTIPPPEPPAPGVMALPAPVTTLMLSLSEVGMVEYMLPAGQEICFQMTATPPAPDAPIVLSTCFDGFTGIARFWGGMPDLSVTSYEVTEESNTSDCTVRVPAMETFADGSGASFAIFHIKATCLDFRTPPAPPPSYHGLQINYVNDGAPAVLAGVICTSIVVDPVVPRSPMNSCTTNSTSFNFWAGFPVTPMPESATYTTTVTQNESGCSATVQPLRLVVSDAGRFAEIDVLINCDPVPEPTYVGIAIEIVDSSGTDREYPGALCANIAIAPAIPSIAGGRCLAATGLLIGWTPGAPILPRASTYAATIISNDTGCTVASSFREEALGPDLIAVVVLTTTCEDPAPVPVLASLTVMKNDRSGAPITTYPGDLCINLLADPLLTVGHPPGTYCGNVAPSWRFWGVTGPIVYPADTTYSAVVASNETGCEVEIDPAVVVPGDDGMFAATIQVWIECDEVPVVPEPTATPTPVVPSPTVVPTEPRTTVDPTWVPAETPAATETPVAGRAGENPDGAKTPDASTSAAKPVVTGLPAAGSGSSENEPGGPLAIAISVLAGLIVAGGVMTIRSATRERK